MSYLELVVDAQVSLEDGPLPVPVRQGAGGAGEVVLPDAVEAGVLRSVPGGDGAGEGQKRSNGAENHCEYIHRYIRRDICTGELV